MEAFIGTMIAGVIGLIQLYVNNKHSVRLNNMERDQQQCKEDHAECKQQHQKCDTELTAFKNEAIARDKRDREAMEAKIKDLESRVKDAGVELAPPKPDTKSHPPLQG